MKVPMRIALSFFAFAAVAGAMAQTICIDPGHPSENGVGTRGKKQTEVSVAWEVAKKLQHLLVEKGYTVVLTKDSLMKKLTNKERTEIGKPANAEQVVRLTWNAGHRSGRLWQGWRQTDGRGRMCRVDRQSTYVPCGDVI